MANTKKKHPKKKLVSPKILIDARAQTKVYHSWFKSLPDAAQKQLQTPAARLIKDIENG